MPPALLRSQRLSAVDYIFIVLMFSVIANGSSIAHVKNAGVSISALRLCTFATLR
jgi:hypothetical protein